jgi:hypothetical protein
MLNAITFVRVDPPYRDSLADSPTGACRGPPAEPMGRMFYSEPSPAATRRTLDL